jgi:hypothetical protein
MGPWPLGAVPPGMDASQVKRIRYGKGPSDLSPVTCDFSGALSAVDDDGLNVGFTPQAAVIRNDCGLTDLYVVGAPAIDPEDPTRLSVWLAAGSVGFEYLISVTVQSARGQILTRSFIIPVIMR